MDGLSLGHSWKHWEDASERELTNLNPKPSTLNPKPQTPNPEPQTLPKPQGEPITASSLAEAEVDLRVPCGHLLAFRPALQCDTPSTQMGVSENGGGGGGGGTLFGGFSNKD